MLEVGGIAPPAPLTVTTDRERARILLGDRLLAETQDGVLLVLLRPSDGVSKQYVLGADLLVPAGNKAFPVSRLHPRHQ